MFKGFILLLLVAVIGSFVAAEEAYFTFKTLGSTGGDFVFKLTDSAKIQEARAILSGAEQNSVHVMGRIKPYHSSYNPRWDFTLDPETISFFAQAIEVCDASTDYVEDHLDEACGAFLPGCYWCPWTSTLTGEVTH